jgi:phospholipid/cholesterol/gamma-HCH transport system permease protein
VSTRHATQNARNSYAVHCLQPVTVVTWSVHRSNSRVELAGELRIVDGVAIWRALQGAAAAPARRLDLDLASAAIVDGAVMAMVVDVRAALVARGVPCEIVGAGDRLRGLVHLYHGDDAPRPPRSRRYASALAKLGTAMEIARAGTDGVPIVVLLNFLVGFVIAYQSSPQLQLFGANIYVADVVGVSITRELAPLMTAIIIAGRSGAAFAAELGTMRVSEEIDALRTMGISPYSSLVAPRVVALMVVTPVLTLVGDVVGTLGGCVVAVHSLEVSARGFFTELATGVVLSDVWTGLVKSVAFGAAIALIGCRKGLRTSGAAAGVGRSTTSTVVQCLFAIVLIDTLFTVVFRSLGE